MSPLISAHQGSCGVGGLPTPERYRRAIDLGVDFVEFDVRRTVDGQYVIYHDPQTPSGRGIAEIPVAEFRAEVGPDALELSELLEMAKGRVGLQIDLKEVGYEADIVRRVLADFAESEFLITSLEDVSIRTIKERYPTVRAGLSLGRDLDHATAWHRLAIRLSELFPARRLKACRADFVAVHKRLATLRVLAYCARKKIPAWVWTVEDERDTARFWPDPRVAVVITNRPDLVLGLS
jgi:glycerophosphoryl diester phosphodiesterase